jgi:hypothetical protein
MPHGCSRREDNTLKHAERLETVLAFCREYHSENDNLPVARAIVQGCGISKTMAFLCLFALEREGKLECVGDGFGGKVWRFPR